MLTTAPPTAEPEALLIAVTGVAQACGLSPRTIRRLDSAGKLPRAITLGGSKRWRAAEIRRWIAAGCPDRNKWEQMVKDQ